MRHAHLSDLKQPEAFNQAVRKLLKELQFEMSDIHMGHKRYCRRKAA